MICLGNIAFLIDKYRTKQNRLNNDNSDLSQVSQASQIVWISLPMQRYALSQEIFFLSLMEELPKNVKYYLTDNTG